MRVFIGLAMATTLVAGCTPRQSTTDDYFDTINTPSSVIEQQARDIAGPPADIQDTSTVLTTADLDIQDTSNNAQVEAEIAASVQGAQQPVAPVALTQEQKQRISNSQDFEVVTARETIETDAAKLEELRSTYKVFEPKALPKRSSQLNLQNYALAEQNRTVGRKRYSRKRSDYGEVSFCVEYADANLAQIAFVNQGGPRKDPLLLDADGDGFACNWTPNRYLAELRRSTQPAPTTSPLE